MKLYITYPRKSYHHDLPSGWEEVAFERFDYIECAVYEKPDQLITAEDEPWLEDYGEPGDEWLSPHNYVEAETVTKIEDLPLGTTLEFYNSPEDHFPMVYVGFRKTRMSSHLYAFCHTGARYFNGWVGYSASRKETLINRFPELEGYDWGNHPYRWAPKDKDGGYP